MTSSEASVNGSYTSVSPPASPPSENHQTHLHIHDQATVNVLSLGLPDIQDTATAIELSAMPVPENPSPPDAILACAADTGGQLVNEMTVNLTSDTMPAQVADTSRATMVAAPAAGSIRSTVYSGENTTEEEFPMRHRGNWLQNLCKKMAKLCCCRVEEEEHAI